MIKLLEKAFYKIKEFILLFRFKGKNYWQGHYINVGGIDYKIASSTPNFVAFDTSTSTLITFEELKKETEKRIYESMIIPEKILKESNQGRIN
jgi:hypothetical protein